MNTNAINGKRKIEALVIFNGLIFLLVVLLNVITAFTYFNVKPSVLDYFRVCVGAFVYLLIQLLLYKGYHFARWFYIIGIALYLPMVYQGVKAVFYLKFILQETVSHWLVIYVIAFALLVVEGTVMVIFTFVSHDIKEFYRESTDIRKAKKKKSESSPE